MRAFLYSLNYLNYVVVNLLLVALAIGPTDGRAQSGRDFVFNDEDGHLLIRFTGIGAEGLDPTQVDEISNQEFSRMVHDRLRADLRFDVEPRDADWAAFMAPQIARHIEHSAGHQFSDITTECRAASCRVIMEQPGEWSLAGQLVVLNDVETSLETFVASHRDEFKAGFMITAYYQDFKTPHIKVFLSRIEAKG